MSGTVAKVANRIYGAWLDHRALSELRQNPHFRRLENGAKAMHKFYKQAFSNDVCWTGDRYMQVVEDETNIQRKYMHAIQEKQSEMRTESNLGYWGQFLKILDKNGWKSALKFDLETTRFRQDIALLVSKQMALAGEEPVYATANRAANIVLAQEGQKALYSKYMSS